MNPQVDGSVFRTLIENTLDAVVIADRDAIIIYANPAAYRMFGCDSEKQEMLGTRGTDYWLEKDAAVLLKDIIPQALAGNWIEVQPKRRDGSTFSAQMAGFRLKDEESRTTGIALILHDITARKQSEAALHKSQRLIQDLIDNSSAVIYAKDLSGRYILSNRGFEELYQLKKSEIIGKTDYDLYPQAIADSFTAKDHQALEVGCALQWESDAPGGIIYLSVKFPMLDEKGQAYGIGGISTDITGLKQAESDREFLQAHVIAAQRDALRELSTPIIPVLEQVIILPLIGSIDSLRAKDITRALLAGISRYRAKIVIIDITGVPMIDSDAANYLDKTFRAARLKGAQTIVTGVSDAVAETIIDLGIDWSKVQTLSDLQTGLMMALQNLGLKIASQ